MLPNNSLPDFYPHNKISNYIVHLSKELHLKDSWKVGLAEVIHSHSWYNIDSERYWVFCQQCDVCIKAKVSSGYYQRPQHLVRALLKQIKHDFQAKNQEPIANGILTNSIDFLFDLQYNTYLQLVELHIKHKLGAPM